MEIKQLRSFVVVAETLSFSKTAEALNFAQSSISDQIKGLENELECKLFERLNRGIALTSSGEALLDYAKKIVALEEEARLKIVSHNKPIGELKIVSAESLCVFKLPTLINEFYGKYPDVNLKQYIRNCVDFPDLLRTNQMDVAFVITDKSFDKDILVYDLAEEDFVLISNKDHELVGKENVRIEDINDRVMIWTQKSCLYRSNFEEYLAKAGVKPKSTLEMESVEGIKQYVRSGFGLTFLPRIAVEKELKSGEFMEVDYGEPRFKITTKILIHKDKWLSPALDELIKMALKQYR